MRAFPLLAFVGVCSLAWAAPWAAHAFAQAPTAEPTAEPAAAPPAEPPSAQPACTSEVWRLSGASVAAHEAASFNPAWAPEVAEMLTCLREAEAHGACLLLQGHFDVDRADDPGVLQAFATDPERRAARAKAQAAVLATHLYQGGAQPGQLHTVPARTERTFRGVLVRLERNCPTLQLGELMARADAEPASASTAPPAPAPAPAPPAPSPLGITVFLQHQADVTHTEGWRYAAPTHLGISLRPAHVYVDGALGVVLGPERIARVGYQARLNAGYRGLLGSLLGETLRLGLAAGYRQSSQRAFDAWLSRSWWLGVHLAQCVGVDGHTLGSDDNRWALCAEQTLAPLGERATRATVLRDRVYILPQESRYRVGFDLGVRLEVTL